MRLNNLLGMLFVASLAMTSCSNDDITENAPGVDSGIVAGQKTWAMLNFSIGEAVNTRAAGIGENGTEDTDEALELAVKSLDLYIFDENGTLEMMKAYGESELGDNTDPDYDASKLAPGTPVEVTSGTKTFCVILNKCGNPSVTVKQTTIAEFLKSVQSMSTYSAADGLVDGGLMTSDAMMMMGTTEVTLHAGISKEKVTAGMSSSDPSVQEANNVVTMYVNRNAAKLDLKLGGSGSIISLDVKDDNANTLAALSNVQYKVNNLSQDTYYFLQPIDANEVYPTPWYSLPEVGGASSWNEKWFDMDDEYKALNTTIYMSENTHEQNKAKVGNTTYVLVKGVYVPTDNEYIVDGYDATSKDFTYAASSTLKNGENTIFSYEYNVAFSSFTKEPGLDLTSTDLSDATIVGYIKALVARRVAEKYTAEDDITANDVVFCANEAAYNNAVAIPVTQSTVYAYLTPVMVNGDTKAGHYTITMKRWSVKVGEDEASVDNSFNLTPLTIGVYNTVTDGANVGLECFYRINVFTDGYAKAHPMYYSVMRNVSYHVSVNSVARIGENDDVNVDLGGDTNQEQPIEEATTFMQCKINVYKWVGKGMIIEGLGQ